MHCSVWARPISHWKPATPVSDFVHLRRIFHTDNSPRHVRRFHRTGPGPRGRLRVQRTLHRRPRRILRRVETVEARRALLGGIFVLDHGCSDGDDAETVHPGRFGDFCPRGDRPFFPSIFLLLCQHHELRLCRLPFGHHVDHESPTLWLHRPRMCVRVQCRAQWRRHDYFFAV